MEKVTKIDLKNAFKALDELEMPKPVLTESVRKLPTASALVEEFYDIDNPEDMAVASEDREEEIAKAKLAKIEKIVDLNAETPEDLEPSYSGKTIIQCPQCMTMFYKDPSEIIVSEDNETVCNVGEKCQHCGNESGYTLVGKVAPVDDVELANFEETPAEEENEFNLDFEEEPKEDENSEEETAEEISEETGSEEAPEELAEEEEDKEKNESLSLREDLDKEKELTEANELPELTDANVDKLLDSEEFKKPISEEEVEQIFADSKTENSEESVEEDLAVELPEKESFDNVEDIDDESVNKCVSKFLNEVYENVNNFEMTDCSLNGNKLVVEGKINFKSGNFNHTSFVLTNSDLLEGYNDSFGHDSKFGISYSIKDKKLYFESINYNYHINENLVEGLIK